MRLPQYNNDVAVYQDSPSGVAVNLAIGTASDGFGTTDTLINIEAISGSAFADSLVGDANNNTLIGVAGNDTLDGGGFDTANYFNSPAGIVANIALGTASDGFGGTDTLISIENIFGSPFADMITGDANNNNFLTGGAGNDTIDGGAGIFDTASYQNTLHGIVVSLQSGIASDDGFGNTDTLINIENIFGSGFADRITGDAQNNRLTGGAGADTFVFDPGFGIDTIADFTAGSGAGHDVIELHNSGFADFASLQNAGAITGTSNTVITLGADRITLTGVNSALLTQDDFMFLP
jgi:Ca2+-binding RTX toxin-like protein